MASPTETFYYYQKQQLQAVRWGNWKYHLPLKERIKGPHFPDTEVGEARLYNLANDLSETTNVIDKHPEEFTLYSAAAGQMTEKSFSTTQLLVTATMPNTVCRRRTASSMSTPSVRGCT